MPSSPIGFRLIFGGGFYSGGGLLWDFTVYALIARPSFIAQRTHSQCLPYPHPHTIDGFYIFSDNMFLAIWWQVATAVGFVDAYQPKQEKASTVS